MTELFRYEADVVDAAGRDLPGLKARFLLDHVAVDEPGPVLDVGCGGGKMLRTLARHRPRAVLLGCDVKPLPDTPDVFEFRLVESGEAGLPYDDGTVGIALLFDVLEHVERPDQMIDEVARVLRPGASVVAFIPVEGEPASWYRLFRALLGDNLYVETKDHHHAFRHGEVESLLGRGFEIVERRYVYHFFGQLMDAGFCALLRVPAVERLFWTESPYHNRASKQDKSRVSRVFSRMLVAANAVAWAESKVLARTRLTSAGVLLTARVKATPDPPGGRRPDAPGSP